MALAQAGGYSSDWTLSLGTSICPMGAAQEMAKKRQKQKQKNNYEINENSSGSVLRDYGNEAHKVGFRPADCLGLGIQVCPLLEVG